MNARLENGLDIRTSQVFKHPNYEPSNDWDNDFALLKLNSPVSFKKNIRPACLPDAICDTATEYNADTVDSCTTLTVAGWGRTEEERSPSELRSGTLNIQPRSYCNRHFGSGTRLTLTQICAGTGEISTCGNEFLLIIYFASFIF